MNKLLKLFGRDESGAIGIGTMIIFIAMVLVAGIAASVLIQTSSRLESQAMTTGQDTTDEVATGLEVIDVLGHVTSSTIDNMTITVRPRSGSKDIDLSTAVLELSDGTNKYVLSYDTTPIFNTPAAAGIFSTDVFDDLTASEFGIIELKDADNSCSGATPVINRGDKVSLSVNVTATFSGISERTEITGRIVPEDGAAGIISFRVPASLTDEVYDLQ